MKLNLKNEKGMTLIEVIAATVILAIILLSFTGLLVQSKKTNKTSETISDATYTAQKEMEKYYSIAKDKTVDLNNFLLKIEDEGFIRTESIVGASPNCVPTISNDYNKFSKEYIFTEINNSYPNYKINIKVKDLCDFENSISFLVEVLDIRTNKPKAIVENVFMMKGTE